MKKYLGLTAIIIGCSLSIKAQSTSDASGVIINTSMIGNLRDYVVIRPEEQVKEVKGSIYLFKNFALNGVVLTNNKKKFNVNNINIDLKNQDFVAKYAKDSLFIFSNLVKVQILNTEYNKIGGRIYTVLYESKDYSIFKYMTKILKKEVINKMNGLIISPAKWLTKSQYFKFNNDYKHPIVSEIQLNKKSILEFIDKDKQKKVKSFVKNKSYSFKNENDIKKILNYYYTL